MFVIMNVIVTGLSMAKIYIYIFSSEPVKKLFKTEHNFCGKQRFIDSKTKQSSNMVRSTWKIVSHELGKNSVKPFSHTSLMVNCSKVSHPKKLADIFNNFFST